MSISLSLWVIYTIAEEVLSCRTNIRTWDISQILYNLTVVLVAGPALPVERVQEIVSSFLLLNA